MRITTLTARAGCSLVTPTNLKPDLEKMLFGQCNIAWIENESIGCWECCKSAVGMTLPSGGVIVDDVYGAYPQLGWTHLVQEFLHSA